MVGVGGYFGLASFILRVRKRDVRMEAFKGEQKELVLETVVDTLAV